MPIYYVSTYPTRERLSLASRATPSQMPAWHGWESPVSPSAPFSSLLPPLLVVLDGKAARCPQALFGELLNWVHQNQTLPPALASQLRRRDGELPQVWGMRIDPDFNPVDLSQACKLRDHGLTASVPGNPALPTQQSLRASPARSNRPLRYLCPPAGVSRIQFLQSERHAKASRGFDEKISCPAVGKIPAFEASVSGSVDACIVANVSLAVTARELHQIRRRGRSRCGFRGHAEPVRLCRGAIHTLQKRLLSLAIPQATLDSGQLTLLSVGIRGLDFPGMLTIGPSFQVEAEVSGTADVGLTYCISGAKLFSRPIRTTTTAMSLDASGFVGRGASTSGVAVTNKTFYGLDGCVDVGAGLSINAGADSNLFSQSDAGDAYRVATAVCDSDETAGFFTGQSPYGCCYSRYLTRQVSILQSSS
ncbi:hypothetical protein C8F04DRAFT_1252131 [Mycena alexandri]|uniref:Uncharacterized protein n=1 Tax=Mycena alexandri TaxID=1745969 RepID=A0AAD6TDW0_9AGAR|nr:hypothetical protein C8F04DRAFT_1252131 [Mycena alexandri]